MKERFIQTALLLLAGSAASISAQTTTVEPVLGQGGRILPSASGILTPHVQEGRFGTSLRGNYLAPTPNTEESRFSNNALFSPSGEFIGVMSDADAARSEINRNAPSEELSERDQLLLLRRYRNLNRIAEETGPQQRSAEPYAEPLPYTQPEPEIAAEPATQTPAPVQVSQPAPEPARPAPEQIWMRGSARRMVPGASAANENRAAETGWNIDPRWFSLGVNEPVPETAQDAEQPNLGDFQEGMIVGGREYSPMPEEPAPSKPSETLARNGRREQRARLEVQEQLETLLLKSPIVSPLAPIRVTLNGSTATVVGIVPNEEARVEAGKLLLEDSRVESVDNQITVFQEEEQE